MILRGHRYYPRSEGDKREQLDNCHLSHIEISIFDKNYSSNRETGHWRNLMIGEADLIYLLYYTQTISGPIAGVTVLVYMMA